MSIVRHVLSGEFVAASSEDVSEEEMYRITGWWAFQGYELERVCLRTREDNNDLRLMIAREGGRVVAVLSMKRAGAKEWGWV
ncbi:hypothetical protein ACF1A9_29145 [Streptomyces sp. NPDC014872]|uniref:hypothetical protein n=1 Tax=Streptomyces sp. NPDC014872 TaxID=3364926 RepID=UPI0036F9B304